MKFQLLALALPYIVLANSGSTSECDSRCARVLGLTNVIRKENGLEPVCLNSKLMKAAKMQTNYQAVINKMTHDGPGTQNLGDRVAVSGYDYKTAGENVAQGMSSSKTVVNGWLNSETHRDNLLSDNVHMGIWYEESGKFWTQVFGRPQSYSNEVCDVDTECGMYGCTSGSKKTESAADVPCEGACNIIMDEINRIRVKSGQPSVCVAPKLMTAADVFHSYADNQFKYYDKTVEDAIVEADYSWKKYANLDFEFTFSSYGPRQKITDTQIQDMIKEQFGKSSMRKLINDNDFTQVGVSISDDRDKFKIIFASTWDLNGDICAGGSLARDTGVAYDFGKNKEKKTTSWLPSSGRDRMQSTTSLSVIYEDVSRTTSSLVPSSIPSSTRTVLPQSSSNSNRSRSSNARSAQYPSPPPPPPSTPSFSSSGRHSTYNSYGFGYNSYGFGQMPSNFNTSPWFSRGYGYGSNFRQG